MSRLRRRGDRGATAVEFALVAPVVFALLGGLLVFGLRVSVGAVAEYSARVGLRESLLACTDTSTQTGCVPGRRSYPDSAAVAVAAGNAVPGLLGSPTKIIVCPPDCDRLEGGLPTDPCPVALPPVGADVDLTGLQLVAHTQALPTPTAGGFPFSPSASPAAPGLPSPTVSAGAGASAQPTLLLPTPGPLPSPTLPSAVASALPSEVASAVPTAPPLPSVSVPPRPTSSPAPQPCRPDDKEGKLVVVQVTWTVPVIAAATRLAPFLGGYDLQVVRRTVTGRRE